MHKILRRHTYDTHGEERDKHFPDHQSDSDGSFSATLVLSFDGAW